MELFAPEFSQATAPPPDDPHINASTAAHLDDPHAHAHAHPHALPQPGADGDTSLSESHADVASAAAVAAAGVGAATGAGETPLRGKAATQGMTLEEKKERQKQQNRRAAERSRNKKREELTTLEMTVSNIQDENNRLRGRLAALLASRANDVAPAGGSGGGASVSGGDEGNGDNGEGVVEQPTQAAIDYAGLARLQAELASAKETLLRRELELGRAQGAYGGESCDGSEGVGAGAGDGAAEGAADAHAALLAATSSLQGVQAEVKTLHALVGHLRNERDALARQRDVLAREAAARRALREAVNGDGGNGGDGGGAGNSSGSANGRAAGVERALLDLRGLVDGVIKTWDQSSVLPPRRGDGSEAGLAPE